MLQFPLCDFSGCVGKTLLSIFYLHTLKHPEQRQRNEKTMWLKCQVIENILAYSWECQYSYARNIIKWYRSIESPALKVKIPFGTILQVHSLIKKFTVFINVHFTNWLTDPWVIFCVRVCTCVLTLMLEV